MIMGLFSGQSGLLFSLEQDSLSFDLEYHLVIYCDWLSMNIFKFNIQIFLINDLNNPKLLQILLL